MDTLCVVAATDSTHSGRKKTCLEWSKMTQYRVIWSGYTRFRGVPGVGLDANTEWQFVEIGRWIKYAHSVKSETINLDRRVDLRRARMLFQSEETLGCILRVSLEYASCVFGYDTSTWYRWDTVSIRGWFEIYCAGSVSEKSRSW